MPNEKVLNEKKAVVDALTQRLQNAVAGVFVDYKGISVLEDTALRAEMRENNVNYTVIKNTLARFAINNVGFSELDSILNGTTSLATSDEDPIAPFRILSNASKKMADKFNVKAAFMDGKILSESEIEELSKLTSKNDLISIVLGTMQAPIAGLACVLDQIAEKGGAAAVAPLRLLPKKLLRLPPRLLLKHPPKHLLRLPLKKPPRLPQQNNLLLITNY